MSCDVTEAPVTSVTVALGSPKRLVRLMRDMGYTEEVDNNAFLHVKLEKVTGRKVCGVQSCSLCKETLV